MTEKMDEEVQDDDSMLKRVDSFDSDDGAEVTIPYPRSSYGLRSAPLPPLPPAAYSSDRSAFPASAGGPLLYPQSPLHTFDFRGTTMSPTPKTAVSR